MNYVFRNSEEALSKLNLINSEGYLNNAGYYLFGKKGPVLLKEVVYPTDERTAFSDMKQFKGNILECIEEGLKYLKNNIHYKGEIIGTRRQDTPEIPIEAFREILINSFAHCHYQEGDYNEISITRSKIRIYNPGGILNDINPVDFASGKIGSKIRNPLIATVLYKNGMIDAFGTGFDRTFKLCGNNNVEYDYNNDEYGFTFVFKRPLNSVDNVPAKIATKFNAVENGIIKILVENPYCSSNELGKKLGKSTGTIQRYLTKLTSEGRLERKGSRKTGFWQVTDANNQ